MKAKAHAQLLSSAGSTTADVAGVMEVSSLDAVYKWTQSARLPLVEIPNFERACGAVFISKQLAAISGHLLIKAPRANGLSTLDFARMHWQVAKAMLATSSVIVDPVEAQEAARSIDVAIEALKEALAANKTTANDLWRFAKICRVANVMRPYLETLGHGG